MADMSTLERLRGEIAAIEEGGGAKSSLPEKRERVTKSDAFAKIVALVNVSDRSEKTLRERLARAEFSEKEIEEAIDQAKRYGFIDDLRYADILIRSRLNQGKGAVGIERELREQDINPEDVAGWPHEFGVDDESERQRALAFLKAHPSRAKNKRDGAYRKLVQKGYSSAIAASTARIWADS